jgi:hypothetical protein
MHASETARLSLRSARRFQMLSSQVISAACDHVVGILTRSGIASRSLCCLSMLSAFVCIE